MASRCHSASAAARGRAPTSPADACRRVPRGPHGSARFDAWRPGRSTDAAPARGAGERLLKSVHGARPARRWRLHVKPMDNAEMRSSRLISSNRRERRRGRQRYGLGSAPWTRPASELVVMHATAERATTLSGMERRHTQLGRPCRYDQREYGSTGRRACFGLRKKRRTTAHASCHIAALMSQDSRPPC